MSAALVDTETGEIVSTDLALPDAGALDLIDDPGQQIVLACERANAWLQSGIAVPIESIVETKAQAAALAAFAVQKQLGKDAELAALEVQRRAERGTGLAIRRGQEAGEIMKRGDAGAMPKPGVHAGGGLPGAARNTHLVRPGDIAPMSELSSNGSGIYAMTDDVTDEQFDAAIDAAKAEGNLSRANVVRKVKGQKAKVPVSQQLDRIEEMAATGHHSTQIAKELGTTGENIRMLAKKAGIKIPADDILRGKHNLNATRIVRETVQALDGLAMGVGLIEDYSTVDLTTPEAQEWAASLTDSLSVLNRFAKQIKKETTHVLDQD